jgi:cyanophycin synthetase
VLVFGDNITRTWKQIIYFNRPEDGHENVPKIDAPATAEQSLNVVDNSLDPLADATPVEDAPDIPESMLLGGLRMIRDSRGVRLADAGEEDGD